MKISNRKESLIRPGLTVRLLLAAVIFQIGFSDHSAAADVTSITLLEAVEIDGHSICLGQIAQIDGHDLQLIQQLNDVAVPEHRCRVDPESWKSITLNCA